MCRLLPVPSSNYHYYIINQTRYILIELGKYVYLFYSLEVSFYAQSLLFSQASSSDNNNII